MKHKNIVNKWDETNHEEKQMHATAVTATAMTIDKFHLYKKNEREKQKNSRRWYES